MCKEKTTAPADRALSILMDAFLECYKPALSCKAADEYLTSAEIASLFNSAYPLPPDKIFDALADKGFMCVLLSSFPDFVWMLTLKKK